MKKRFKAFKLTLFVIFVSLIMGAGVTLAFPEFSIKDEINGNRIGSINQSDAAESMMKEEKDYTKELVEEDKERNQRLEDEYNQAFTLFHSKKNKDAIDIADSIIKEDPSSYKAYSIKGIALCFSGEFDEGMKNIDKSLELKSDYGYGLFNKALAYELYGYYDTAIEWYYKALKVENYVWSYYGISSIYGRRGDVANTVKYLSEAIKLNPAVKDVAKDEKDFDNVRGKKEFEDLLK